MTLGDNLLELVSHGYDVSLSRGPFKSDLKITLTRYAAEQRHSISIADRFDQEPGFWVIRLHDARRELDQAVAKARQ